MARKFQEAVAIDLKQYHIHIILHMIDVCARLSAAILIFNKKQETIVRAIFHYDSQYIVCLIRFSQTMEANGITKFSLGYVIASALT